MACWPRWTPSSAGSFSSEDERLLVAFATSAASAIATARSYERGLLRRSIQATEGERGRWEGELRGRTLTELGREDAGEPVLTVHDEGHGFDPAIQSDGYGFVDMRERLALVRGALDVRSATGRVRPSPRGSRSRGGRRSERGAAENYGAIMRRRADGSGASCAYVRTMLVALFTGR